MPTGIEFSGYLAPSVHWKEGDELFFQPVYLVPVEVFTTGFLSRPEYKTVMAVVEAVGGKVHFVPEKKAPAVIDLEPCGRHFPVNISAARAVRNAESAAVSEGREGWGALSGSSHAMVREDKLKACWKVWIRSGENLVDSVSGKHFPVAEFLGLLLPHE